MREIGVPSLPHERFRSVLAAEPCSRFGNGLERACGQLEGRTLWHVNSTAQGGGVAEMLHTVLGYLAGAGIRTRWQVIEGDDEFFEVTKRIHNLLHGEAGDGGELGQRERVVYERNMAAAAQELRPLVNAGDVVVLHDPQTAGLAQPLIGAGAHVIWSCHVGADQPNDLVRSAWHFLSGYVAHAHRTVFSRPAYTWEGLDPAQVAVIPPCIDAFSPKNQSLHPEVAESILKAANVLPGRPQREPTFYRQQGAPARVQRRAQVTEDAPLPADASLVTQISRWDRLKDPIGVLRGFVEHVPEELEAHLVLAGPTADAVRDDPEGAEVLDQVRAEWGRLPRSARQRVHLVCIPMEDLEENGAVVNALQRHADVVVQKSLAEGFGLTVAEAMWKSRPVVGSRVGGIQDQVTHGVTGLLVDDPSDLKAFGCELSSLLEDRQCAEDMGERAHERVRDRYLTSSHLLDYLSLIGDVLQGHGSTPEAAPRAVPVGADGLEPPTPSL